MAETYIELNKYTENINFGVLHTAMYYGTIPNRITKLRIADVRDIGLYFRLGYNLGVTHRNIIELDVSRNESIQSN